VTGHVGKYEILGILAGSTSGAVYLASDPVGDRQVVVKQLVPSLARDPGFMSGFRADVEIMFRLDHPNCVHCYDYFEDQTGAYIVSEHVAGASLRSLLDNTGRLEPQQALGVTRGALSGLAFAHELGLVHRDVKPENLLADREGTCKLTDFGQAFFTGEVVGGERQWTASPAYISPEQVRGDQGDVRSDVYSTGVLLYELLAGRPPFIALSRTAVMRMHLEREPPALNRVNPRVPVEVSRVLRIALSKDPSDRYSSAGEFLAVLEEVARDAYGGPWLESASIAGLVGRAAARRAVTGAAAEPTDTGAGNAVVEGETETTGDAAVEPSRSPSPGPEPEAEPEPEPLPFRNSGSRRRGAAPPGMGSGLAAAIAGLLVGAAIGTLSQLAANRATSVFLPAIMALVGLLLAITGLQVLRDPEVSR